MSLNSRNSESIATLAELTATNGLKELEAQLTRMLSQRRLHHLLKDGSLHHLIREVESRVKQEGAQSELFGAAILGRLAAISRRHESEILLAGARIFSQEPPSIDSLDDGDQKAYAARCLALNELEWAPAYRLKESVLIEAADAARKELLRAALNDAGEVTGWLSALASQFARSTSGSEGMSATRRNRRALDVALDILAKSTHEMGDAPGEALAAIVDSIALTDKKVVEEGTDIVIFERCFALASRIIEMRFSLALEARTYAALERGKRQVGLRRWNEILRGSEAIKFLRRQLLEACLVIARQNRTDGDVLRMVFAAFPGKAQALTTLKQTLSSAKDLDEQTCSWWTSGGSIRNSRRGEQQAGVPEDVQIGALMLVIQSHEDAMTSLMDSVVPMLKLSDGVLAATVSRAAGGYKELAQTIRRLGRMRRLSTMELKGLKLEYNPAEHELLGDQLSGVRRVRVVRDGVKKDFGGRVSTIVKPWVEPI